MFRLLEVIFRLNIKECICIVQHRKIKELSITVSYYIINKLSLKCESVIKYITSNLQIYDFEIHTYTYIYIYTHCFIFSLKMASKSRNMSL